MYEEHRKEKIAAYAATKINDLGLVHPNIRQFIQKGYLLTELSKEKVSTAEIDDSSCDFSTEQLKNIALKFMEKLADCICDEITMFIAKYFYADVVIYNNYDDISTFIDGIKRIAFPRYEPPVFFKKNKMLSGFIENYASVADQFTELAKKSKIAARLLDDMILMTWFQETETVVQGSPKITRDEPWTLDVVAFFKFIEFIADILSEYRSGIVLMAVISVGSYGFHNDCYKDAVEKPSIMTLRKYAEKENSENMGNFYTCSVNFFNNKPVHGKFPEQDDHLIGSSLGFLLNIEYCVLVYFYHINMCRGVDYKQEALNQYGWIFNGCRYVDIPEVQNSPRLLCLKKSDSEIYNRIVTRTGSIYDRIKFSIQYFDNSVRETRVWDASMQEEEEYDKYIAAGGKTNKQYIFPYSIHKYSMRTIYQSYCVRRDAILEKVMIKKTVDCSPGAWGSGDDEDKESESFTEFYDDTKAIHLSLGRESKTIQLSSTRKNEPRTPQPVYRYVVGGGGPRPRSSGRY